MTRNAFSRKSRRSSSRAERPGAERPRLSQVYRRLLAAYGPQGWWPVTANGGDTPAYRPRFFGSLDESFRTEIALGAILTQNTAWTNVVKALANLRKAGLKHLSDIQGAPLMKIERLIRPAGYFRQKARKLRIFSEHVLRKAEAFSSYLTLPTSRLRDDLLSVWGIGPETADSILLYAARRPVFVVDAYTKRILGRMGYFHEDKASYGDIQRLCMGHLPRRHEIYNEMHALFVAHAKNHCRSKPECPGCPLLMSCRHGGSARA